MKKGIILVIALTLVSFSLFAQGRRGMPRGMSQGQGQEQGQRTPPPFVSACENKAEGESCTFTTKRGKSITSTCMSGPRGMVCGERPRRK